MPGSQPGRPKLKDHEKLRIMYLYASIFCKNRNVTSWKEASTLVAQQISEELGFHVAASGLRNVYKRYSKPVSHFIVKKRGGRKTKVTDEFKEQLAFVLADPDIPLEMKSSRKIIQILPECPISRTTLRGLFKQMNKDQLVPKAPKQANIKRKDKLAKTVLNCKSSSN